MDTGFLQIALNVVGGLGIFLLGMKHMSEGLQAVSGDRLRKILRRFLPVLQSVADFACTILAAPSQSALSFPLSNVAPCCGFRRHHAIAIIACADLRPRLVLQLVADIARPHQFLVNLSFAFATLH